MSVGTTAATDLKEQFEEKYARAEPTVEEIEDDADPPESCGFVTCNPGW